MAPAKPSPEPISLVIADWVYRDNASGKLFALGIFSSIFVRNFPCTYPSIAVYICLTEGRGEISVKLRLIDVDDPRPPVFESERMVQFIDPTEIAEIVIIEEDVVFPEPGECRLQLYAGDEFVRERRFWVLETNGSDS